MNCQDARRFLPAYVDGELAGLDRSEIEAHGASCTSCRAELHALSEYKLALRAALAAPPAPAHLRTRVRAEIASTRRQGRGASFWTARIGVPLLAAAAAALVVVWPRAPRPLFVEQARQDHRRDLPVDVSGPDPTRVANWLQPRVPFHVVPPVMGKAQLLGARLHRMEGHDGALLVYDLPDDQARSHKVSVFVFDPQGQDPGSELRDRKRVGAREVYLERRGGYRSAMFQDDGLGYVVTTDVDEDRLLRLVGGR